MRPAATSRRAVVAVIVLAAAASIAGCGAPTSANRSSGPKSIGRCTSSRAKSAVTVDATNALRFVPASICLRLDGTVTWINTTTGHDHTTTDEPQFAATVGDATIPPGGHGWNLKLAPGRSARLTFRKAGVYHYFCIPHETLGMVGVVNVLGAS